MKSLLRVSTYLVAGAALAVCLSAVAAPPAAPVIKHQWKLTNDNDKDGKTVTIPIYVGEVPQTFTITYETGSIAKNGRGKPDVHIIVTINNTDQNIPLPLNETVAVNGTKVLMATSHGGGAQAIGTYISCQDYAPRK